MLFGQSTLNDVFSDAFAHELGQLVSTLEAGWNSDGSFPIVVVEALVEGKLDEGLLTHGGLVIGYFEESGSAGSLGDELRGKMEVILIIGRHWLGDDAARVGIEDFGNILIGLNRLSANVKESRSDLLVD